MASPPPTFEPVRDIGAPTSSATEWPAKHALEAEERNGEAKRAKLYADAESDRVSAQQPQPQTSQSQSHPASIHEQEHDDADGEPEIESDYEPEPDHDHEEAAPSSRASPDKETKPKKGEKKKRVRTDRDRERDRERRRERDRARRAREKAEREEASKAEEERKKSTKKEKKAKSPSEDSEVYCVCQGANDEEGGTMVGCETCDNWFHPACVGIDEEQVDMLDVYICASCEAGTTRRTSYRRVCKNGCGRAARSTSKFCSSRCAFTHARSLLASVDKKDAKALQAALTAYPSPSPSVTVERPESSAKEEEKERQQADEESQDTATLSLLSSLRRQSAEAERALAILARRQAILGSAIGVWEALVPAGAAEEPKKRSKNKKRDGEKDPRPCGFDPRIVWSDKEVEAWDGAEREEIKDEVEGEEDVGEREEGALARAARLGLCAVGRRCDRHQGWQKTTAVALEVEATQLTRRRDELATLGDRIERAGATTVAARRARGGVHAALAAKAPKVK